MVTYCTGSITAKRRAFRNESGEETVNVDNDEVLATFTLNKKLYVVVGTVPFSNMTVQQFVASSRALRTNLPLKRSALKELLVKVGVRRRLGRRMGSLMPAEYRAVCLAAKLEITTKNIYVNYDGLEYSRRNRKVLSRFLKIWGKTYNVFAAVSDTRFIPKKAAVLRYTENGIEQKRKTERNKTVSTAALKRRLRRAGMDMNIPFIKTVVVCDG